MTSSWSGQSPRLRPPLHLVHRSVCNEYRAILSGFVREDVIRDRPLIDIDPNDSRVYLPTEDVYLGGAAMAQFVTEPVQHIANDIKNDCKRFMIEICNQIRKRINLDTRSLLARMQVLDPVYAKNIDVSPRSITDIAAHFPTLVPQEQLNQLDDEWREFRQAETAMHTEDTSIPSYWYQVRNVKNALNQAKFETLSHFMTSLTALPHSTAAVERVFSEVNCRKTSRSNRMTTESVKNRILD